MLCFTSPNKEKHQCASGTTRAQSLRGVASSPRVAFPPLVDEPPSPSLTLLPCLLSPPPASTTNSAPYSRIHHVRVLHAQARGLPGAALGGQGRPRRCLDGRDVCLGAPSARPAARAAARPPCGCPVRAGRHACARLRPRTGREGRVPVSRRRRMGEKREERIAIERRVRMFVERN